MKRLVLLAFFVVACTKKTPPSPVVDAGPSTRVADDAREIAEKACLSCHTMAMLQQQRLTEAQWSKVVTKMVGWGANLETNDTPALVAWLSASYGPDAGPYPVETVEENAAATATDPRPDGVYAGGGTDRGRALYTDRCSGCHGPEAKGHIGVALVDRPFLYHAEDVAKTIRKGRGKMAPIAMADADIADVLAYLRALR